MTGIRCSLHMQVVLDALDMALWQRRPNGVIHHSDQGSQYTSIEFGKRCREASVRPSMGSVGDAYDNAMAESFFATLECELLDRRRFKTQAEARMTVFEFIEGFYNPRRRHSSLGYLSPVAFERQYAATALEPGARQHAVVLAPVKERPGNVLASLTVSVPAVLDSHSTRQA
jgi:putative transposase